MQEKQRSLSLALLQLLVVLHSSERYLHTVTVGSRQHRKLLPQGKTVHVCLPGGFQASQRTRKPGKEIQTSLQVTQESLSKPAIMAWF